MQCLRYTSWCCINVPWQGWWRGGVGMWGTGYARSRWGNACCKEELPGQRRFIWAQRVLLYIPIYIPKWRKCYLIDKYKLNKCITKIIHQTVTPYCLRMMYIIPPANQFHLQNKFESYEQNVHGYFVLVSSKLTEISSSSNTWYDTWGGGYWSSVRWFFLKQNFRSCKSTP